MLTKEESEVLDFIQEEADKELEQLETFPPSIVTQIEEVYRRLNKEREEWLKDKRKEEHP